MFRYRYDENFDGYVIADYIYRKGENFDVTIPAMHKGKPVVAIGYGAFVDSDGIVLAEGIMSARRTNRFMH